MEDVPSTPTSETVETPSRRMPLLPWIGLVIVAFALGLGVGYMVWALPLQARAAAAEQKVAALEQTAATGEAAAAGQAEAKVDVPENVKRYDVPIDDDPAYGSSSAPITIIEFSDYECPFCRRWHQEVWPQIEEKYGDKVRLVYRDFPLYSIHPNAGPAAEAANCAGDQGRYWEFNEMLWKGESPLGPETYTAYAKESGLDMDAFQKCIDDRRHQAEVDADFKYASELGVRSTPTFFINGLAIVGAQPFEVFQQVIELELAGKIPSN